MHHDSAAKFGLRTALLGLILVNFACMTTHTDSQPWNFNAQANADNIPPQNRRQITLPTVRIGPCVGVRIGPRKILFAAGCIFAGFTHHIRLDYLPGVRTTLTTSDGISRKILITSTKAYPNYDPEMAYEELNILSRPITILGKLFDPLGMIPLNQHDQTPPLMIHVAIVTTQEILEGVPIAEILPTPLPPGNLVMVSGFGCKGTNSESPFEAVLNPARIEQYQGSIQLISGAQAASVNSPTVEPLCLGEQGGPILTLQTNGYRVVGLAIGKINGHLIASRLDDHQKAKVSTWIKNQILSPTVAPQAIKLISMRCTQSWSYLNDGEPRDYELSDFTYAVSATQKIAGASENITVKIEPSKEPLYAIQLALNPHCIPVENICYSGFYRNPVNAFVQAAKLEFDGQTVTFAHWVTSESGPAPIALDESSCRSEILQ